MKNCKAAVLALSLALARSGLAQLPPTFTWVNIESDAKTMAVVRRALHDKPVTAIREVGVEDGFALVMTASREHDAPTPDYDLWTIYNTALSTGRTQILASGYGVKILDWVGPSHSEIAISYYDCWECEAATLFTTLHFTKGIGWSARWDNLVKNGAAAQPGAVVKMTDVGEPYEDAIVEQVFAVIHQPDGTVAAGSWVHSRDTKAGTISDEVERYTVNASTGKDRVERLSGRAAIDWEREICNESNILIAPSLGQDSKACRSVIRTQKFHP